MSALCLQSVYDAETHLGSHMHHHRPSVKFCRRAVPRATWADVQVFCTSPTQRKQPWPKLRGVLATISCDEIAGDDQRRLQKCNGVRRFDMYVHPHWPIRSATLTSRFFEIMMHLFQRTGRPQLWAGTWRLTVAIAAGGGSVAPVTGRGRT